MTARILFEIHPNTVGGTERFLARFLERLDRRRFIPLVVSPRNGKPLQLIASLGIRTQVVNYFSAAGIRRLEEFIRDERVSIVQSGYYASHVARAASLASVPHVWRLGGHVEFGSGARSRADARMTLEMIRLLSHSIICNTRYVQSQFGRARAAVEVIPNGIDVPVRVAARNAGAPLRVGMIAHFTPQKRHEDFISAAAMLASQRDDVHFTIFGSEYPNAAGRRYGAQVRHWCRTVPRLTVQEAFHGEAAKDFDIIVLPSVGESFSNAILEAMAAGVPVVAARSGGNPELVEDGRTGILVTPKNPRSLARAIALLLGDRTLRIAMGKAGHARARSVFSLDLCVRRYEGKYRAILRER